MKYPVVDRIHPKSNNFVTSVENRATGDLKLSNSPALALSNFTNLENSQFSSGCVRYCEKPECNKSAHPL